MSTSFYLHRFIYLGHDKAFLDFDDKQGRLWIEAFEELPEIPPSLWSVVDHENPLIHVCLFGGSKIYWAMVPDHVFALARGHLDKHVFIDEYGEEHTGQAFLDRVSEYDGEQVMRIGEHFC